jgi:hypothetical protein
VPTITATQFVQAPVAEVFAAFTDVDRFAERVAGIVRVEKLTPGPVGVGTQFKETRKMFGRESTETMTFAAFEPDARYELTALSCGTECRTEFRFTPEGDGTRVDVTFSLRALTLYGKLFKPLAYLMSGMCRRLLARDMGQLRDSIEGNRKAA